MSTPPESLLGKIKNVFLGIVSVGEDIFQAVRPFLSPFLPAPVIAAISSGAGELSAIASIITQVEATSASMGAAATSSAKAAAALPGEMEIVQTWLSSGLPGGSKIKDQTMFKEGVSQLNTALVTILNSVE